MKKRKSLIIVVLTVFAFALLILARQFPSNNVSSSPEPSPAPTSLTTTQATQDESAAQSVTILRLREKQFDGRDLKLGPVLSQNESYTRYYTTYKSGSLTISGIMNVPRGTGPFPVLVLNHGYIDPEIYTNGRGLKREQDYLARRGYVVLHPDYRNHADSDKDPNNDANFRVGYIEDVINAVYAIKQSNIPQVNKDRIGMLGHSMGGGIAISVMVTLPDLVRAYVLFAPVSSDARENFNRWMTRRPDVAEQIVQAYGRPEENPKTWDAISPITYVSEIKAPVMIHHGTVDSSVPIAWSERFNATLQQYGKNTVLHIYNGQPHEFTTDWPTVMARTVDFFDRYVK